MSQKQFHRAYELMPQSYRAELIGGVVHEPSPVSYSHGHPHAQLAFLLGLYSHDTPGTAVCNNCTVMLSGEDEVQPDVILRLDKKHGGRSRIVQINKKLWVKGAPDLVAEVACDSRDIDLRVKKERYRLAGVPEYIVLCVETNHLYWFDLPAHQELKTDANGIFRSHVFPGLWIDGNALLRLDGKAASNVLTQGLQSKEHAAFVAKILGKNM